MKMKYITYNDFHGFPSFIIFPEIRDHFVVANSLGMIQDGTLIGAGFIIMNKQKPECYGESVSLKLKMNADDTKLIQDYLEA